MITSTCACGQILFFENTICVHCKREVGFLPDSMLMCSLEPIPNQVDWYSSNNGSKDGGKYKKCVHYPKDQACNWMIPEAEANESFCLSCRLSEVIPDLTVPQNLQHWRMIEAAKRRFVYSALRLQLPIESKKQNPNRGLSFRFLADIKAEDGTTKRVTTGHENGLITLNIEEADDSVREKNRLSLKEPYRTLLGHFRHETGHYYWDRLIADGPMLEQFRTIFGDERKDYGEALKAYYKSGAPSDWQNRFVSAYATMHPWEDWAETWAHFLHIQDSLEVARDFGFIGTRMKIEPTSGNARPFDDVIEAWSELTIALNCMNRSMGLRDLYPFVLSKPVIEKLHFIYDVIATPRN